ncbi:hypothetical protein WCLP8_5220026 [uncultured Gammaproteobacteria bacterium]
MSAYHMLMAAAAVVGLIANVCAIIDFKRRSKDVDIAKNTKSVIFVVVLSLSSVGVLFIPISFEEPVPIYQRGAFFVTKSPEVNKGQIVEIKLPDVSHVILENINLGAKPEAFRFEVMGGVWSQVSDSAQFLVTIVPTAEASCSKKEAVTISMHIPQHRGYSDVTAMETATVSLPWVCHEHPSKIAIEIFPGTYAVSIHKLNMFVITKQSTFAVLWRKLFG